MGLFNRLFSFLRKDVAIDLGTAQTLVYLRGKGVVLREPSVVAIDISSQEPIAFGHQAKSMLGKTHEGILARRPIKDGVIENLDLVEAMLSSIFQRVFRNTFTRANIFVAVPSGANEVERKAVRDASESAGAVSVHLITEPVAAAVGIELPIHEPKGNMIVDIGGGTTEIAVISLNGIVSQASIKVAGDEMDEAIISYIRRKYSVIVGEQTSERIKIDLGNVYPMGDENSMQVRGQDLVSGMPRVIEINSTEVREALREPVGQIIDAIRKALEMTPPDLVSDVIQTGVYLTGGGAKLVGMPQLIEEETTLPVNLVEHPLECVVMGVGKVVENREKYREVLLAPPRSSRSRNHR